MSKSVPQIDDDSQLRSVFENTQHVTIAGVSVDMLAMLLDEVLLGVRPTVSIYAERPVLEDTLEQFTMRTRISELVNSGDVSLYTSTINLSPVVVTEDTVYIVVSVNGQTFLSSITDESDELAVRALVNDMHDGSTEYSSLSVPLSALADSFSEHINPDAGEDLIDAFYAAADSNLPVDGVTLGLVIGAYHAGLQHDIGNWCSENNLGSAPTVSRRKDHFVNKGVIKEVREVQGIGRPLHRLVLSDDLQGYDSASAAFIEVMNTVQDN